MMNCTCLRRLCCLVVMGGWVMSVPVLAGPVSSTSPAGISSTDETFVWLYDKIIVQGGPIVWFQIVVSVIGLAFALERFINLRRARIVPTELVRTVDRLAGVEKTDELLRLCDHHPSTLARMIHALVEHRHDSPADVVAVVSEIGRPELKWHLQKAYPVIIVATLEPLLGLFGTVWGMMGAFDTIAAAGELGNPSLLAADIGIALVTTVVGLAVAIPMLALYHYFKSKTHTYAIELESVTGRLIKKWIRSPRVHEADAVE